MLAASPARGRGVAAPPPLLQPRDWSRLTALPRSCAAGSEYHDQAAERRITIGAEDAVLTSRRLAQGKKSFAFGTKPACKLGSQRQISGYLAGAKIHNDLVHVFRDEGAQALVQRLKVSGV